MPHGNDGNPVVQKPIWRTMTCTKREADAFRSGRKTQLRVPAIPPPDGFDRTTGQPLVLDRGVIGEHHCVCPVTRLITCQMGAPGDRIGFTVAPTRAISLWLEIVSVGFQRLWDISASEAMAEGFPAHETRQAVYNDGSPSRTLDVLDARQLFFEHWESAYPAYSCSDNQFVWILNVRLEQGDMG